jgi:hypothetical protein
MFTTSSTATSRSSSSSFPIAGVIIGILGTLIVVAAICAFAWYKVKTHRRIIHHEGPFNQNTSVEKAPAVETVSANMGGQSMEGALSGRLRYE